MHADHVLQQVLLQPLSAGRSFGRETALFEERRQGSDQIVRALIREGIDQLLWPYFAKYSSSIRYSLVKVTPNGKRLVSVSSSPASSRCLRRCDPLRPVRRSQLAHWRKGGWGLLESQEPRSRALGKSLQRDGE
jgi:hypothetical protein